MGGVFGAVTGGATAGIGSLPAATSTAWSGAAREFCYPIMATSRTISDRASSGEGVKAIASLALKTVVPRVALNAALGASTGALRQVTDNAIAHRPLGEGVGKAAWVGGVASGAGSGVCMSKHESSWWTNWCLQLQKKCLRE